MEYRGVLETQQGDVLYPTTEAGLVKVGDGNVAQLFNSAGAAKQAENAAKLGGYSGEYYLCGREDYCDNAGFCVDQYGLADAGTLRQGYVIDRWIHAYSAGIQSRVIRTKRGMFGEYNMVLSVESVTQEGISLFYQCVEDIGANSILAGRRATFSISCLTGAANPVTYRAVYFGYLIGSSTQMTYKSAPVPPLDVWNRVTLSADIPANARKLQFGVGTIRNITQADAGSSLTIAQAQLVAGDAVPAYTPRVPAVDLMRCQRFYEIGEQWMAYPCVQANIIAGTPFKVTKRIKPALKLFSAQGEGKVARWGNSAGLAATVSVIPEGIQSVVAQGSTVNTMYHYGYIADANL